MSELKQRRVNIARGPYCSFPARSSRKSSARWMVNSFFAAGFALVNSKTSLAALSRSATGYT
jgi:hypothetical protein